MEKPKTTPADFFLWAGAIVSLYGSIIAFVALMFDYLNYAFPDPLNYYASDPYQNGASYEMASFIIFGALALVLLRVIHRTIEKDPSRSELWVRRWALFLTLFLAGLAMAIDLIVLLTSFLNGEELSVRFVLKVLIVLLVSAATFMHFLADFWGYWTKNPRLSMRMTWGVGMLGILTIAAGFLILGTPWQARQYRLDEQRVSDLQQIQSQVVSYYQQKQALPIALTDLNDSLSYYTNPTDPQTGQPYEYVYMGPLQFRLCASFSQPSYSIAVPNAPMLPTPYGARGISDNWQHAAGEQCFERTIDPALYPAYPKPVL